jgi:hypothetical protein
LLHDRQVARCVTDRRQPALSGASGGAAAQARLRQRSRIAQWRTGSAPLGSAGSLGLASAGTKRCPRAELRSRLFVCAPTDAACRHSRASGRRMAVMSGAAATADPSYGRIVGCCAGVRPQRVHAVGRRSGAAGRETADRVQVVAVAGGCTQAKGARRPLTGEAHQEAKR